MDGFLFNRHLEDDEHVSMIVHKHWLIGIRFLVFPTISIFGAATFLFFRHSQLAAIVGLSWEMLSVIWWLRNFFDYYLDAWIITDHGIIDLEWLGWFHRQSARILYSDIQGVSTEIHGITGTLMRYGDVTVEKISTGSSVSLSHVSRPRRVESQILKNMETYLHTKNLKNAKHIEELLSKFVAEHINEDDVRKAKKTSALVEEAAEQPRASGKRPSKKSFSSTRIGSSHS